MKKLRIFYGALTVVLTINLFVGAPLVIAAGAYDELDTIDTYSNGDLNGNNGGTGWAGAWSSNTAYDVTGANTCAASTKSVTITDANTSNRNSNRAITGPDSGNMYFCFMGSVSYSDYMYIAFYSGATFAGEVGIVHSSGSSWRIYSDFAGGTPGQLTTGITHGTWLIINVNFISSTQVKVRWKQAGGAWSAFTANQTWAGSVSSPTTWRAYQGNDGSGNAVFYYDQICLGDPEVSCSGAATGGGFNPWQHWVF